jgi:ankyrin repeat protein
LAALHGHLKVVELLLGNATPAVLNAKMVTDDDRNGMNALMCAAAQGHSAVVQKLLSLASAALDVAAKDARGFTVWHHACSFDGLLSTSAGSFASGLALLRYTEGKLETVAMLAEKAPSINLDLNVRNVYRETGFLLAVKTRFHEAALALLHAATSELPSSLQFDRSDLDSPAQGFYNDNAFTAACRGASPRDLILIEDGILACRVKVSLDHRDAAGLTGLHIAVRDRNLALVRLLLDVGPRPGPGMPMDLLVHDNLGYTAFGLACLVDSFAVIREFVLHLHLFPSATIIAGVNQCPNPDTQIFIMKELRLFEGRLEDLRLQNPADLEIATTTLADGTVVETQLGQGTYGIVYDGTYLNQPAAIKEPKGTSPEIRKDFIKEAAIWASLGNHDNILPLLTFTSTPRMLMVCPRGRSAYFPYLRSIAGATNYFSIVIRLVRDMASGLDYAHRIRDVVHGDLNQGNVLVFDPVAPGLWPTAKISDFGMSKIRPNDRTAATTDSGRGQGGTYRFMAPELLSGRFGIGGARETKKRGTDVWAFAMLAYSGCFQGREPYCDAPDKDEVSLPEHDC